MVSCNCRSKEECPLAGRCNPKNIVYQACISPLEHNSDWQRAYIGISVQIGNKDCKITDILSPIYYLENKLFNLNICEPWGSGLTYLVKWKRVRKSSTANSFNGICNLCIDENNCIINFIGHGQLLKERNEVVFKRWHKGKFRLSWLGATDAPTLDDSRNIGTGWFLLDSITFNSVVNFIWTGIFM